jgi:ligand-binding sensor domain-containing protein
LTALAAQSYKSVRIWRLSDLVIDYAIDDLPINHQIAQSANHQILTSQGG